MLSVTLTKSNIVSLTCETSSARSDEFWDLSDSTSSCKELRASLDCCSSFNSCPVIPAGNTLLSPLSWSDKIDAALATAKDAWETSNSRSLRMTEKLAGKLDFWKGSSFFKRMLTLVHSCFLLFYCVTLLRWAERGWRRCSRVGERGKRNKRDVEEARVEKVEEM